MKKSSKIFIWVLSAIAICLVSCDERVTPMETIANVSTINRSQDVRKTLIGKSWQFSEIMMQAGNNAEMVFSRERYIGLNNSIARVSINFKTDGTIISKDETGISQKGTWKLLNYDTQLVLAIDNQPVDTFEIETLANNAIQYSSTMSKDHADSDTWASTIALLQAPDTVTEIKTIYKLSSI